MLGLASGCAHARPGTAPAAEPGKELELNRMREALNERDERLRQLEGRLALMEAEQRQFRYALEDHQVAATPPPAAPVAEPVRTNRAEARPNRASEEPRVMLKLHEGGIENAPTGLRLRDGAPLQDVPVISERLAVVPLPGTTPVLLHAAPPARPASSPAAEETYSAALDALGARDFRNAALLFERFATEHPADARVAKATYWRAEALFALRTYEPARRSFETYLAVSPRGDRAPDAWLKLGHCRRRLGDGEGARAAFDQLRREFPASPAARMAAEEEP